MSALLPPVIPTEDFWSRQANAQTYSFDFAPFGIPTHITANDPGVLSAARLSAGRYSRAPYAESQFKPAGDIRVQIVVRRSAGDPVPDDLPEHLAYSGVGDWITVSAGEWGHGFANLQTRTACLFLSPSLAADVRLVSRFFIDHHLLNFIVTEWAMLHASCVLDPSGQRLIVMVASHGAGKSTTALRLAHAGYAFLADGMALLRKQDRSFVVGGYPIGEVKLREDVLSLFPDYTGEAVQVREQRKTIVDLRAVHPDRIVESLITPPSIQVCLMERAETPRTQVAALRPIEAAQFLHANTVYWNDAPQLEHNTAVLHHLLRTARLYRLKIGTDPDDIIATLNRLTN